MKMRETPDIETSSDDYALRFSGRAGEYFLKMQAEAVMAVVGAGECGRRVLDVGGGHGQIAPVFTEHGYEVTVLGSSHVSHARLLGNPALAGQLNLVTGDVLDLPFPDHSFDMVVSVRLVPHIDDWPRLVREFCRVSRQAVIFDYPSLVSINALTPLLFSLKKTLEGNTRTYTSFFQKDLAMEFSKNGFRKTAQRAQFFLPMVIHRVLKGAAWLQYSEYLFRLAGLTRVFGTPVILRMDRVQEGR